jgi:glutamyl-tRNA reductase
MTTNSRFHSLTLLQWAPSDQSGHERVNAPFRMSTCQREIALGIDETGSLVTQARPSTKVLQGQQAYRHLLEVVCGLKSRLLGETEIVAQFRDAYSQFERSDKRCPQLMKVLDRLLMDSKFVRSNYLNNLGQYSYAGLSKSLLRERDAKEIILFGSGNLAQDLIKTLAKKTKVTVVARNRDRLEELKKFGPNIQTDYFDLAAIGQFAHHPFLINTIGMEETLFDHKFFDSWKKYSTQGLFIDLAQPSPIKTQLSPNEGVFRLDHLFLMAEEKNKLKLQQVAEAHQALDQIIAKRYQNSSSTNDDFLCSEEFDLGQRL